MKRKFTYRAWTFSWACFYSTLLERNRKCCFLGNNILCLSSASNQQALITLTFSTSTCIWKFLETLLFYPYRKISAATLGASSKISLSQWRRCYAQNSIFEHGWKKTGKQLPSHDLQRPEDMLWYLVNPCINSSVLEKLHFTRPHNNRKTPFPKRSALESVFERRRFRWQETMSPRWR